MGSKISALALGLLVWVGGLRAAESLTPVAPLVGAAQITPASGVFTTGKEAARSAQELGLPAVAIPLYRELLEAPAGVGVDRAQISLSLVTALLDDGDIAGAEEALQNHPGAKGSAWHLRMGLVLAHQKKLDAARVELSEVKREELEPGDVSWHLFLQGMIANLVGDTGAAIALYGASETAAPNEMAKARFVLAGGLARLRLGTVREADIENARKNVETFQGKAVGYDLISNYVILLDAFGQKPRAVAELQRQLRGLPPQEREAADNFRLLLGLISGAEQGAGRDALGQLLVTARDPKKQRIALQMLANSSFHGSVRPDFRKRLDELIGTTTPSPILEDLLLVRARLGLTEKAYDQAENDATQLLQKFPGSQLKASAYAVRTAAAWEQRRYSRTVEYANKARSELPAGQTRAELGVLVAEAWYRGGDFRSAAEAYSAALRELPAGMSAGKLMFQRVQSEIEAVRADPAQQATRLLAIQPILDELARNPAFDLVSRWQAEWNLSRALRAAGESAAAYARVNTLLASVPTPDSAPTVDFFAQMSWLRAFLSLETGQPEQAMKQAEALIALPMEAIAADRKATILSEVWLVKAQANFALGHPDAAVGDMGTLRRDFPRSEAAASSYIVQAEYNVQKGQLVEAQKLLTGLADDPNLKESPNAAYALLRAALLAQKRGQNEEANRLIEKLVTGYPKSELVFTARLTQGDLLRSMNQFSQAEQTYKSIINAYPQHLGIPAAQIAHADSLSAQAVADPSYIQRAGEIYESLLARPGISPDLRVEAGYKLGLALLRQGKTTRAQDVWWKDVAHPFLIDNPKLAAELGTGLRWMARSLLDLGDLLEKQEKLEDAKAAWQLMVTAKLPGRDLAVARLARYSIAEVKDVKP